MKTKRMISIFVALVMMIGLLPIMASAATSGSCGDNATWSYDVATQTLTISGTGAMYDYEYDKRPWYEYEDSITTVVVNSGITYLGNNVFNNFENLVNATLPESVTSVGTNVFRYCKKLEALTLPNKLQAIGAYMFYGCRKLNNILIPESVTQISDNAFLDCSAFTTFNVPKNVRTIGADLWLGCTSLAFITVDKDNAYFENDSNGVLYDKGKSTLIFYPPASVLESYQIPYSVKKVEDSAFYNCDNLTEISLPNVTTIGDGAFFDCGNLTEISLPNVTMICDAAFFKCYNLTEISLPNVTTIGDSAFSDCGNLTEISLPNVTTIGDSAFSYCGYLTEISLHNVTTIEKNAFQYCYSLLTVHYLGTKEDWSKVSINTTTSDNESLINATRHYCTEGERTESTCSEEGKKGDWYCSVCEDTVLIGGKMALNPDNHTNDFINGICSCGDAYKEPEFEDGYYQIANAGNLFWFAELVNVHGDIDACAILKADIDLENRNWYPIGVYNDPVDASGEVKTIQYVGTFDGNYHSVSNFIAHGTGSQGLFGYCSPSAVVKNVGIIGADVKGWNAGAVIAYGGTVENCYAADCNITAYTTANANGVYAGSIAGAQDPVVKNCFAYNCSVNAGEGNTVSNAILSPIGGSTATNCYYYNVTTNGEFRESDAGIVATSEQVASGEIAYKLGTAWGQKVGVDNYPVFYNGKNHLSPKLTVTNSNVKVETLFEDAVLIVASYKGEKMVDTKIIPVSGACTKSISSTGLNVSNYDEIKAFLWKDLTTLKPMCEKDVYDNTGEFDGEWVSIF